MSKANKDWHVTVTLTPSVFPTAEEARVNIPQTVVFNCKYAWEAVLAAGRFGMIPEAEHKIEVSLRPAIAEWM